MSINARPNSACAAGSTGFSTRARLAGAAPRKAPGRCSCAGRTGRGENPPPQLGQTLNSTVSTHSTQNVHSNEQMRASAESGGNGLAQFSQVGRSSSMVVIAISHVGPCTRIAVLSGNQYVGCNLRRAVASSASADPNSQTAAGTGMTVTSIESMIASAIAATNGSPTTGFSTTR